jgi:hypothetical protein
MIQIYRREKYESSENSQKNYFRNIEFLSETSVSSYKGSCCLEKAEKNF